MKRCECGKEIGIKRTLCVSCENNSIFNMLSIFIKIKKSLN